MTTWPLSPLELTVVILAAYRATRLVTADSIFDEPRDWLTDHAGKLGDLVGCPYCAGWWLSVIAYVAAVLALGRVHAAPVLAHMVEAWAVIGGQALLNAIDLKLAD